jgi:monoamine oxidase
MEKPSSTNSPIIQSLRKLLFLKNKYPETPLQESLEKYNEQAAEYARQRKLQRIDNDGRRDFIKKMGMAAATAGAMSAMPSMATGPGTGVGPSSSPRVAVIGAGLAGMRTAHRLSQLANGYDVTVYEASNRLGGRCYSSGDFFDNGQVVERGGELIDTNHTEIRNLATSLGLHLDDALLSGNSLMGWIDGTFYTEANFAADFEAELTTINAALQAAPNPWYVTYNHYNPEHQRLDNLLATDWFAEIGISPSSKFVRFLQGMFVASLGLAPHQQSALVMLAILDFSSLPMLHQVERFRIRGGNDQLISRMHDQLPAGSVITDKALTAIGGDAAGPYTLSFNDGSSAVCDALVLALPFSVLRHVDIAAEIWNSFRPEKRLAIEQMVMASHAKIQIQCNERVWNNPVNANGTLIHSGGYSVTDVDHYGSTWESTGNQSGTKGVLTNFIGGTRGTTLQGADPFTTTHETDLYNLLNEVENVYPGTSAAFTGKALTSFWHANPWTKGSYSTYALGQMTTIKGASGEREGNIFFAGEHTELDFGFLNSAVASGERVAMEIHQSYF